MKQALAEAKKAESKGEIPIGAVVVCQNQIIARSGNQTEALNDVTAHASDSIESAQTEINRFFQPEEIFTYQLAVTPVLYTADELTNQ